MQIVALLFVAFLVFVVGVMDLGAWVGHSKDKEEAAKRAGVARIVDEELRRAQGR